MIIFADPLQIHTLPSFLEMLQNPHVFVTFWQFWQGAESLAPATQNDASTSRSGTNMWCFQHSDFEMCFSPQQRALFRHLNFQNALNVVCFVQFDFEMCFAPQGACTFSTSQPPKVLRTLLTSKCASRHNGVHLSTSQLPKVVRTCQFLTLLISKCASRHNGMQFFISHLARWLRTRRFSEPTF